MLSVFAAAAIITSHVQGEVQPDWVHKDHSLKIAGKMVKYQTTAGMMPIRSKEGDVDGRIFFTYYKRTDVANSAKRPVTFVFNGGPGSASVWLHLGFVGPKRPKMGSAEGFMPPPPYELVTNDESILPESDIVTIDPVGTGYSRPDKPEDGTKFWGVDGDISSVGEFIRSFLSTENRWLSPIFVMGESYGGIRGSGLSIWLHDKGIGLSGLILVSPLIGPAPADGAKTTDTRPAFFFPTFATTAWYHHRLSEDMQKKTVDEVYQEALKFARSEYLPALSEGDKITPEKKKDIAAKLSHFTGLSDEYLEKANLRINDFRWYKELLRSQKRLIGRYDSRYVGFDLNPDSDRGGPDPSYTQVQPVFTSTINDYLPGEIGYETTLRYYILGDGIGAPWKYPEGGGPLDKSGSLRQAIAANPYTKVMVAMGYYDVACPMGTNDQLLDNLSLDPLLANNIVRTRYQAGHMIYLDDECRRQLHRDVAAFIKSQSAPSAPKGSFKKS
ncbi:MAG: hypothetical protein BGO01_07755 [Armatimonadetes bacterium 55-13]|nr:peptidase S10 [Armatimonadota bacterium]OJU63754.1 MAG: hypothetical protein BGO01_07755 [Armatimonadetes bacterium 55-13]